MWTRRGWLQAAAGLASMAVAPRGWLLPSVAAAPRGWLPSGTVAGAAASPADFALLEQWAQQAVEAARTAGASYAEARLTRTVTQTVTLGGLGPDIEVVGMGVRALVRGYWGFAASPVWVSAPDGAATGQWLAREAVGQATVNAHGTPREVDLGTVHVATGSWSTPLTHDPFTVPVEEKLDEINRDISYGYQLGLRIGSTRVCWRQERVLVTSEGTRVHQTIYQTEGEVYGSFRPDHPRAVGVNGAADITVSIPGLETQGTGYERFSETKIPTQLEAMPDRILERANRPALGSTSRRLGIKTIVCDGRTMAQLLAMTLGPATQLDRALGYEANAGGTSYLEDPLGMVGHAQVASPLVTVTANRSAPTQLATVQWDEEGVAPEDATLVKDGVLVDFQTTREQAAWLAPYYAKQGRPVRSHGYAAAQDALYLPMQHMPNLALAPGAAGVRLEDLVADVADGLLLEGSHVEGIDYQCRTGLLMGGEWRQITNGKLGKIVVRGAVLFDALALWKHVTALGGPTTAVTVPRKVDLVLPYTLYLKASDSVGWSPDLAKGQPGQHTAGYSVQAVAATITNQTIVDDKVRI
jgi:TldD protein